MACTTLLVGRKASYDGSCIVARNDDSPSGVYTPKKFIVVTPDSQKREYESVLSHVKITLPENPMRYTSMPNVSKAEGIWAAAGINEAGVSMTATETITTNARVLGADPLVTYEKDSEKVGGIGEEDIVYITLPYIHSAREGVIRLGKLLEQYGTYESNGIAFGDDKEIWYLETIGGHHWMARRLPDDSVAILPNQLSIDAFDFEDAFHEQKEFMGSADLKEFVEENHLSLNLDEGFDPRAAFGSQDDSDHVYNTPRAWFMARYLAPNLHNWNDLKGQYGPESDIIPWCVKPEKKVTIEDVKYILSARYQTTPFDPYNNYGIKADAGKYRPIGINRTDFLGVLQTAKGREPIEWIAFGSNVFNVLVPFYTNVEKTPHYLSDTTEDVNTNNFYWSSRLVGAMADASYRKSIIHIERYQEKAAALAHQVLNETNKQLKSVTDDKEKRELLEKANEKTVDFTRSLTDTVLLQVLNELSNQMKNSYARSDA